MTESTQLAGTINFKTWVAKPTRTMTASASIGTAGTYSAQKNIPDMGVMEFLSSIFQDVQYNS